MLVEDFLGGFRGRVLRHAVLLEFDDLLAPLALLVGDDVNDVVELLGVGYDGLRLDVVHEFLELVHDLVLEL